MNLGNQSQVDCKLLKNRQNQINYIIHVWHLQTPLISTTYHIVLWFFSHSSKVSRDSNLDYSQALLSNVWNFKNIFKENSI